MELQEKKLAGLLVLLTLTVSCGREIGPSRKHFGEGMLDLKAYHDNLTTALIDSNFDEALWLAEGLDTTLIGMTKTFTSHRLLKKPFGVYYEELLEDKISLLKDRLTDEDAEGAIDAFKALTANCNTCHRRHDQEKPPKFLNNNLKLLPGSPKRQP